MNSQWKSTNRFILLPELNLITHWQQNKLRTHYKCSKESDYEVCPKCATISYSVHDKRSVKVQDAPIEWPISVLPTSLPSKKMEVVAGFEPT